jgi:hypothetical protein
MCGMLCVVIGMGTRSQCGANEVGVVLDDPVDEIGRALAAGLRDDPEFEVAGSIVVADAVLVVDVLERSQRTTEQAFHHEPVFSDVGAVDLDDAVTVRVDVPGAGRRDCRVCAADEASPC